MEAPAARVSPDTGRPLVAAVGPAVLLALLVAATTGALFELDAAPASAQAAAPFELRFQTIAHGDITLTGNTVVTCTASDACQQVQSGAVDGHNGDFAMEWVDVDPDPSTFNSSTATVTVPAGGEVLHARLVWGGELAAGPDGAPPPAPDARGTVRLATPASGAYVDVAADRVDEIGSTYQGVADVTALVAAGGSGAYTVADVQVATGTGRAGGWALVVVMGDPAQPLRSLTVFDGYQQLQTGDSTDIEIAGFVTPPVGPVDAELGTVGWEGDRGLLGDSLQLDGAALVDDLNPADDAFNSTIGDGGAPVTDREPAHANLLGLDADVFDATGLIGTSATAATVTVSTTGEFFRPGVVTAAIELLVPDLATDATKTFTDLNGGPVLVGDELEFTISSTNTGNDAAVDTTVTDPLPDGLDYVPGSMVVDGVAVSDAPGDDAGEVDAASRTVIARVGDGAGPNGGGVVEPGGSFTVTFRATVAASALGRHVQNSAGLAYLGETAGQDVPFTAEVAPDTASFDVVTGADLSLTKSSDPAAHTPGAPLTYTIEVDNDGPSDIAGARLVDRLAGVLDDPTWTCEITTGAGACGSASGRGDVDVALDLGVDSRARIVVTGDVVPDAVGPLDNTATVTLPDGTVDPDPDDNTATHRTDGRGVADLSLAKRFVGERFEPGTTTDFELVVRNDGPQAVSGATVEDRLGAGMTPLDWRCRDDAPPGCATEVVDGLPTATVDLEPGEEAVLLLAVSIDPRVDVQLTNLALVRPPDGTVDLDPRDDSVLVAASVVPNLPPRLVRPIIVETDGQQLVTIDLREFVVDPEGFLDLAGVSVTIDPAVGTATVDPDTGVITVVLTDEVVASAPANGGSGPPTVSFAVEICDLRGGCITETVTLRLTAIIPATGGEPLPLVAAALGLLTLGGVAVTAARRRG